MKFRKIHFKKKTLFSDEVRYERNFFKHISEHKEIVRMTKIFDGGLLLLQPAIKVFLHKTFDDYNFLWSKDMEERLKEFADSNPLTVEIRDKFISYDAVTNELYAADKISRIDVIEIHMNDVYEQFIAYSQNWKKTLGNYLSAMYKKKLSDFVTFINDMEFILNRNLNDLDDIRIAMNALETIRDRSIG